MLPPAIIVSLPPVMLPPPVILEAINSASVLTTRSSVTFLLPNGGTHVPAGWSVLVELPSPTTANAPPRNTSFIAWSTPTYSPADGNVASITEPDAGVIQYVSSFQS